MMNEEVDPEDMLRTIEQSARVRDQERRARERVMLAADSRAPLRTRDRSPLRSRITKRATEPGGGFQNRFLVSGRHAVMKTHRNETCVICSGEIHLSPGRLEGPEPGQAAV